jgi:hypothetical protein
MKETPLCGVQSTHATPVTLQPQLLVAAADEACPATPGSSRINV